MAERITCPYCRGVGRLYDHDEVGDPCFACREDGFITEGDDAYPGAVEYARTH